MYAYWRGNNMKDLTKEPLIDLVKDLSKLDVKVTELSIRDHYSEEIDRVKMEYNDIINEIVRRFPPLKDDVNLQPMVLRKTKERKI